jgi:NitT/TauT family transport system ATP-binding protein
MAELLNVEHVRRTFPRGGGEELLVLDDVNLTLREGEIVGLLGRSGSGKSTLLRLIAGLSRPQGGNLSYMGTPIHGPVQGVAMVFQGFALFPWMTVLENVQLGLEALACRKRDPQPRLAAIDLIGWTVMKAPIRANCRAACASASVSPAPWWCIPTSFDGRTLQRLDVLTAENLRTDLIELWGNRKLPIKGILLVTHNIEEAVLMCDRVLLFSSNPGQGQRRHSHQPAAAARAHQPRIRGLCRPDLCRNDRAAGGAHAPGPDARGHLHRDPSGTCLANQISGLIEALAAPPYNGKADLPDIAYEQELEVDELFPVAEAMQLLRLADVEGGDIKLTHMGKRFADSELNERKEIFSRALVGNVPLAAHIRKVLDERASHSAPKTRFLDELEDHMAEDAAEETLKTVVSWARFGELFSYDDDSAMFSLENPT